MRTPEEIKRQINGLENQKSFLPEYSKIGTPNWKIIDAQIDILNGGEVENYRKIFEYDEEEEFELYSEVNNAEDWLLEIHNDDLFEEKPDLKQNKMKTTISIIAVNDNITLVYNGERIIVNRLKNASSYAKVIEKVKKGREEDILWIQENFSSIKDELEFKTNDTFSMLNGKPVIKGTTIPVPDAIMKKLIELERDSEPILPLLKFWRKLSQNPSEESRKDLYGFMIANNIPITEEGDIVTEKGVVQKPGGFPGDLLDKHTRSIENNIGNIVSMPRENVNPNRNETCSFGLHVGAPDYVRDWYKNDIIIECIVNPKDVVSVPTDYKNTKMRVCSYRVAGYSRKHSREVSKVVKLNEFFSEPLPEQQELMLEKAADKSVSVNTKPKDTVVKKLKTLKTYKEKGEVNIDLMTAPAIVAYIFEVTGEKITFNLRSKKSIVKKAKELLEIHKIKNNNS